METKCSFDFLRNGRAEYVHCENFAIASYLASLVSKHCDNGKTAVTCWRGRKWEQWYDGEVQATGEI